LNTKHLIIAIGIITLILVTSFLVLLLPPTNENGDTTATGTDESIPWNPEWYVSVGDTFEYFVILKNGSTSPCIDCGGLNGTSITVKITYLPQLPTIVNSSVLIESLLKVTKTEMYFTNGSALPAGFVSYINSVFSLSFLPTGVWDAIEALLPRTYNSTYTGEPYMTEYFGRTGESYNIGRYDWAIDAGGVSEGNVTHTTGIPFMVSRYWDSLSDPEPGIFVIAELM
jgi:hypothetical protein